MPTHAMRALSCLLVSLAGAAASIASDGAAAPSGEAANPRAAFLSGHPGVSIYVNPEGISTVYGRTFSTGKTAEASAAAFVSQYAAMFNVDARELVPMSQVGDGRQTWPIMFEKATGKYKFNQVHYTQFKDGYKVFRSGLVGLVRNEAGSPLVQADAAVRDLRGFSVPADAGKKVIDFTLARDAARAAHPGTPFVNFTQPDLVVWGGIDTTPTVPALCYVFEADTGSVFAGNFERWLFLVDALTLDAQGQARIVFSEDRVENIDVTGQVQGMATPNANAAACSSLTARGLPYAQVDLTGGGTTYANANGQFTVTNGGSGQVTLTAGVKGHFFQTYEPGSVPGASTSMQVTPPGPANFMFNTGQAENTTAEVNAYICANEDRDYLLVYEPTFPTVSTQTSFPVNVMVSGTCNAFYSGSTINFYPAGGGCNNTAFGTVVYHEYGHNIVEKGGSGQGAYGEGFGDVMGILLTDNPITGIGFQSCGAGIRTGNNTMQYPCSGEIHTCGTLLSGCVWSLRNQLQATNPSTFRDILSNLVLASVRQHSGSSSIDPSITITFMTLDDNDGNLNNGTPHYAEIQNAFTAHSMPGPAIEWLSFSYPDGLPTVVPPATPTTFRVSVVAGGEAPQPNTGVLHVNTGSGFVDFPMTQTTPNNYQATIPASPCGGSVSFYVTAQTVGGHTGSDPSGGASAPNTAAVASAVTNVLVDDFETNRGWTVGGPSDTATTGIWTRVDPVGTAAQPEDDHSATGTTCFVTGQGVVGGALGDNDVDGGQTTLTSPTLNMAAAASAGNTAKISYWRWYSNDTGGAPNADTFTVDISADNGTNWVRAETVGPTGAETHAGWFYHEFNPASFITPTATVKLRFIASDLATGSVVEAAVDDFAAVILSCAAPCPADFDQNGQVNPADVAGFVNAWASGLQTGSLIADFNHDGVLTPSDVAQYVNTWASTVAAGGC